MSAIETLIKIKKSAKSDDLITLLDEVIAYEKLSKSEAFRDLSVSETAQKKLPLLAGAYKGDLYSLSLILLARNIIRHLENEVPEVLAIPIDRLAPKMQKRLELVQDNVIKVQYDDLTEYHQETMAEQVVAVFTENLGQRKAILIVVRDNEKYDIYQGYYVDDNKTIHNMQKAVPYEREKTSVASGISYHLSILTYSLQGNNAYPFAELGYGETQYTVMMPDYTRIWIDEKETGIRREITLSMEERNALNLAKTEIEHFVNRLLEIIIRGLESDETAEDSTGSSVNDNQERPRKGNDEDFTEV